MFVLLRAVCIGGAVMSPMESPPTHQKPPGGHVLPIHREQILRVRRNHPVYHASSGLYHRVEGQRRLRAPYLVQTSAAAGTAGTPVSPPQ